MGRNRRAKRFSFIWPYVASFSILGSRMLHKSKRKKFSKFTSICLDADRPCHEFIVDDREQYQLSHGQAPRKCSCLSVVKPFSAVIFKPI